MFVRYASLIISDGSGGGGGGGGVGGIAAICRGSVSVQVWVKLGFSPFSAIWDILFVNIRIGAIVPALSSID